MRFILISLILITVTACSKADTDQIFEQYLWENRVVLVFAPNRDHPALKQQRDELQKDPAGMKERDLVKWFIIDGELVVVDDKHQPHMGTPPLYRAFDVDTDKFTTILIGKDGTEKLRSNDAVPYKDLFDLIDQMPMRRLSK